MTIETTPAPVRNDNPCQPGVWKSRWGYYPISYATFLKVKKLYKAYWQALHAYHRHLAWERKLPANRVVRPVLRDARGRKTGEGEPVPIPEPVVSKVFSFTRALKYTAGQGRWTTVPATTGRMVLDARHECSPRSSPEEVLKAGFFPLAAADIDLLLAALEAEEGDSKPVA